MTKFIDTTKGSNEKTKTVFTHIQNVEGWEETTVSTGFFKEVKFLGKCETDGDMFSFLSLGHIFIFKRTKGSEFD